MSKPKPLVAYQYRINPVNPYQVDRAPQNQRRGWHFWLIRDSRFEAKAAMLHYNYLVRLAAKTGTGATR